MPTFENAPADADEVQTVLRALAHATRSIDDPRDIYSVLGSLTSAVASLSQSLHQIAAFHDGGQRQTEWVPADSPKARSAAYRVSWDLHRAGEMVRQVGDVIADAHEAEATLAYHRGFPEPPLSRSSTDHGLSL
ncbi:hypothetical protein [Nocardioides sp. T2.26MG-1]|uniref:hypothetical protein n=1 Tax=Nocardioides sp. T2.26MG-1 TaxID=3041166 RepID=UPI0024777305|nr:hypothetical protein [Nocardioides sp. T2.26MG-1]CAI9413258.1 hypothetical protein HIDPHFAB_01975 [Nocardioides sp. T2.26MG-1]